MKQIKLTQGKYALVDDKDFEWLSRIPWYFTHGYARVNVDGKKVYMHRLINKTPCGTDTDHINRNKLDNRRSNLRTTTHAQNLRNVDLRNTNKSGHKGVFWRKERNKWEASVWNNYHKIYLGIFRDIKDAIQARQKGEELYWI